MPQPRSERSSRTVWAVAAAAVAAVFLSAVSALPAHAADDLLLADFEQADAAEGTFLRSPTVDSYEVGSQFASKGSGAFHLTLGPAGTPGDIAFGISQLPVGSVLDDADWSSRSHLHVGVVNATSEVNTLYLVVRDTKGAYVQRSVVAQPYDYRAFNVKISDLTADKVDIDNIAHLQVSSERSAATEHLWVDDIRLTDTVVPEAEERRVVAPALIKGLQLPATSAQTRDIVEGAQVNGSRPADEWLTRQAAGFSAELDAVDDKIATLVDDLGAAQAINKELAALTWQVRRFAGQTEARATRPSSDFGVASAESGELVYPRDLPCDCSYDRRVPPVELARGEAEATQLVMLPYGTGLTAATARVVGRTPGLEVSVAPVASLDLSSSKIRVKPSTPTEFRPSIHRGWTPDPIVTDQKSVDVTTDDLQAFWVEVRSAHDTEAGDRAVTIELTAEGVRTERVQVPVTVWDIALDEVPHLRSAIGHDPKAYAEPWGITDPAKIKELTEQKYAFLANYKLQPDNIYRKVYEERPPTVNEVRGWEKLPGGLDKFNVWYFDPRVHDTTKPETWDAAADELITLLRPYVEDYREAGLMDKAYLYCCDETGSEYNAMIHHVLDRIDAEFSDLKVLTTATDSRMGLDSGLAPKIDWWVKETPWHSQEVIDRRRQLGGESWWYLHAGVANPHANVFIGYDPGDLRTLLGPLSHRADVDGFLYYRVDRWYGHGIVDDAPLSSWDPLTWNDLAGDGSLFYPGSTGPIPSIRLANLRDGMEDYNLIDALADAAAAPGADPALVAKAEDLVRAEAVARNSADFERSSTAYKQWRREVAHTLVALG
ncbi:DUF4091 domain-containing protein [Propionibacteriaceae bacterium Y1700]|uniref:DUF4091 domain-containing protein n=1 Tax=Microlunatus sp. Y1700 TaxID=3418487 RepID=UPI003DA7A035